MEAYKRWVRRNKEFVHSLESLANGMTWLLPERFSDSEIGPEAVTTILGIITAINEHIIDTTPTQTATGSAEPNSFPYSLCLSTIKDLETLVEVVAQHYYGDDKKWNFLAVTEAIKVLVRLSLFRKSGYKMLLCGGETPNDEKDSDNLTSQHQIGRLPHSRGHIGSGYMNNNLVQNPWNLEGKALSALSRFGENARLLSDPTRLFQVKHHHETMEPSASTVERPTLLTVMSKKGLHGVMLLIGEVLFITRPLIYVLFIRKYGTRSWTPWFLSLAVDCIGTSILPLITSMVGGKEQMTNLSASEKDEVRLSLELCRVSMYDALGLSVISHHSSELVSMCVRSVLCASISQPTERVDAVIILLQVKRRKLLLALYLMRDPFFGKYTRKKLESTEKILEPIPIIGFLSAKVVELLIGAQTRYTYMSGS